jgi:hypothetical protein
MATAKWATPGTRSSNLASTTLDSLANGSTSAFVTYDNSSALDLYAVVTLKLGSLNPTTGASVTLRVFTTDGTDTPDNTGSVGGGEVYAETLTTGSGAKVVNFRIRLHPHSMRLCVTNNSNVSLAASGNELYVKPHNESVA